MGYIVQLKDGSDLIAKGVDVRVHDGHLSVLSEYQNPAAAIAVYAPGQWVNARRDADVTYWTDGRQFPISIERLGKE